MKKKALIIAIACMFLAGCYPVEKVSKIYPVIEHETQGESVYTVFEMPDKIESNLFCSDDVYMCDESSRVIAIYYEGESEKLSNILYMYLYLSKEDYEEYAKKRYNIGGE